MDTKYLSIEEALNLLNKERNIDEKSSIGLVNYNESKTLQSNLGANNRVIAVYNHFSPYDVYIISDFPEAEDENEVWSIETSYHAYDITNEYKGICVIDNNDENLNIVSLKMTLEQFKKKVVNAFNIFIKDESAVVSGIELDLIDTEFYANKIQMEISVNDVYVWGLGTTGEEYWDSWIGNINDSFVDGDSSNQYSLYDSDKKEVIAGFEPILMSWEEYLDYMGRPDDSDDYNEDEL